MNNIITNIEIQKNNKDRVNIYVDHSYYMSCDSILVYKKSLKKGQSIDVKLLEEIISEDNFSKGKNVALKYITRCLKTEHEVRTKLERTGFDESTINQVIEYMKSYSFVDDQEYTRLFIKEKIKKYGITKIKYDLRHKGIEEHVINEQLDHNVIDETYNTIRTLAEKKYGQLRQKYDDMYVVKRKLTEYLVRKGYEYDMVGTIISEMKGGEKE